MRSVLRSLATVYVLCTLLLIGLTNANPIFKRASVDEIVTATPAVSAPTLLPRANPPLVRTFCEAFVKQCYITALEGQIGEVTVSHSCERNGPTSFEYACFRNSQRITTPVLKALGLGYWTPGTTTTILELSTATVSTTRSTTSTTRSISTVRPIVTTRTTTRPTTVRNVQTILIPSTTVVTTRSIPVTRTATTRVTTTVRTTRTVTTTDQANARTEVLLNTAEVPIFPRAEPQPVAMAVSVERRASQTFCLAYKLACDAECIKNDSRLQNWMCENTVADYTLSCYCANGETQTQHALAAVVEDKEVVSVTTSSTTTTRATSLDLKTTLQRLTTTIPATRVSTVIGATVTVSTTTTRKTGRSTRTTAVTFTTTTSRTVLTTRTVTTTTTTRVPLQTQIVLSDTGYARGLDATSGALLGALGQVETTGTVVNLLEGTTAGEAVELMAVRHSTGVFKLSLLGEPGSVILATQSTTGTLSGSSADAATLSIADPGGCGSAGTSPGPIATSGDCEAFIFSPIALDTAAGATTRTVNLRPVWFNPSGSNHTGVWGAADDALKQVKHVGSQAAYTAANPDDAMFWFTLRFPYATAA